VFTRPIFPSPVAPGWDGNPFGFPPGFAPRDYSRRTPGRGQVTEHEPEPTLYVIDLASNPTLITRYVRPRVALAGRALSLASPGPDRLSR
jgi:hypothetical protein